MTQILELLNATVPVFLAFSLAYLYDMSKKLGKISEVIAGHSAEAKLQGRRLDRLETASTRKKQPLPNMTGKAYWEILWDDLGHTKICPDCDLRFDLGHFGERDIDISPCPQCDQKRAKKLWIKSLSTKKTRVRDRTLV